MPEHLQRPSASHIERLVRMALDEDAPWGDLTTQSLVPSEAQATAHLRARETGVLCGEDLFRFAMQSFGNVAVEFTLHDGDRFAAGDTLATATGPARSILQAERVALNFTQRLSAIATQTALYVAATEGTSARIVDTRKTTPGLRILERYAVRCGGGGNHRFSLSDAVLVKDNHLAAITENGADNITEALRAMKTRLPHTTHIEVEVDRLDQIEPVLAAGIDTVLLDNFSLEDLRAGVQQIAGRALVEASGNARLDRIAAIAATGVDLISVGALTHSVRALDLGLDFAVQS
ncbi:carboxylating nicotinate-nucleotide diphosphorylase [Terriglobus sp.]|uniref:carboxylating nicotinate-nucleotide diphosphorylase n=1 Tax=Terriglobus sp. TaxID=1889013 RepID=UPI003B00A66C